MRQIESKDYFASGIAHDLNNILCTILIQTDLLLQDPHTISTEKHTIQIRSCVERSRLLTQQLLAHGKQESIDFEIHRLNSFLLEFRTTLKLIIDENTELIIAPSAEDDFVAAIPGQIEQILLNLVGNAREALPNGGTIKITTQNTSINEKTAELLNLKSGQFIILSVSDDGIGIDEHTCKNIFKPYFSTKSKNKNHGLGLTIVSDIIKQLNGRIDLHSTIDKGTTFNLYIPILNKDTF
ncbi:MAG: ATP-binding protein [Oligoflexia bacterium]|nr:ATP-binding protein [Oligoflexia bacterium]